MKILFKNTKGLCDPSAILYNKDESLSVRAELTREVSGELSLEIDPTDCDHLRFVGSDGESTGKLYHGALGLGVEYKDNPKLARPLTYLYAEDRARFGRVESLAIKDEKNLAHRPGMSKTVHIFIPSFYDGSIPFDILYFFDGQNLFANAGHYTDKGDPYGSWQLDAVVNELYKKSGRGVIIVGIDNADEYRSAELFMDPATFGSLTEFATGAGDEFRHGYLDNLSDFIRNTLHPIVKEKYCVSEDNIGIGGSSMGGIASFYCALHERGFYKYCLSYSPAFALYEMSAFDGFFASLNFAAGTDLPRIHIYCGSGDELERMLLPSAEQMRAKLVKHSYPENKIHETYDSEKPHNEESWRLILPESFTLVY